MKRGRRHINYDPAIRKTEGGRLLYHRWQNMRHNHSYCPEWDDFGAFYTWAMDNGYSVDTIMVIRHKDKPCGPENCFFIKNPYKDPYEESSTPTYDQRRAEEWNRVVNNLRSKLGLEPLKT